jgi:hypothetical protein
MAEKTDAFGNPISLPQTPGVPGKPPTGGTVRPSESGLPNAQTETTGVPQQYDTKLASSGPQGANQSFGKNRSISFGTLSLAIFLVIVIVGGGLLVFAGIFKGAKDAINDVRTSIDSASSTGSASVTGIGKDSLFAAGNFGEAKTLLKNTGRGDPYFIRIAPDRIDSQLVKGSTMSNIQVKAGSDSADIFSTSEGGSAQKTFRFAAIGDAVPSRAVRRGANALNESTSNINYIVVSEILGDISINGFFKDGKHFSTNGRGSNVKTFG